MNLCRKLLLAGALSLVVAPTMAQVPARDRLLDLMGEEQFLKAGLDKLDTQEQEALLRWLVERQEPATATPAAAAAAPAAATTPAPEAPSVAGAQSPTPEEDSDEIVSRVLPPFDGWSGKTEFRLENGQVWRQRHPEVYRFTGTDTRVRITRNFLGFYWMELLASGEKVSVRRVE